MTQNLIRFLKEHPVMCLATSGKEGPHATPVFYTLQENPLGLIFLSDPKTRHMQETKNNPRASVGIYLETKKIGLIQGAQLWGEVIWPYVFEEASRLYFKAFPTARLYHIAHPQHVFGIFIAQKARFINNRLGIGKPQEWSFI